MEACSLISGLEVLALVGSIAWDCSMLSRQQAAPCQYLNTTVIKALPWPRLVAVGPAEGEGLHSPENPSGAG